MDKEEMELDPKFSFEEEKELDGESDRGKGHKDRCHVSPIKINCDLEVSVGNKNKIIYVSAGKLQYFTANAICCSDDKTIEVEYCGSKTKCICGEALIKGCLGYYKIVKSGIIFIPSHKLYKFHNDWFATDILSFKVKDKDFKFDVVFTYYENSDSKCGCNKRCKSQ